MQAPAVMRDYVYACHGHLQGRKFDLVAAGINRGDNCGLHVIYSGTVGAAREAACKVGAVHGTAAKVHSSSWGPAELLQQTSHDASALLAEPTVLPGRQQWP